jgi:hypothetical protein
VSGPRSSKRWQRRPCLFCEASPAPKKCGGCRERGNRIKELDDDWKEVVRANIRLVLFVKQQGLSVPSTMELTRRYPLEHY